MELLDEEKSDQEHRQTRELIEQQATPRERKKYRPKRKSVETESMQDWSTKRTKYRRDNHSEDGKHGKIVNCLRGSSKQGC